MADPIIIISKQPGYRKCGRAWSGRTLCEVKAFKVPSGARPDYNRNRPKPKKRGAEYVLHTDEVEQIKRLSSTGHYQLAIDGVSKQDSKIAEKAAKVSAVDEQLAAKSALLKSMEDKIAAAERDQLAAAARAEDAERRVAEAEAKVAAAEASLAGIDRQARSR